MSWLSNALWVGVRGFFGSALRVTASVALSMGS